MKEPATNDIEEISKAEERAQAYENGLDYYHYTGDNPSVAYKAGYKQAEKDVKEALLEWAKDHQEGERQGSYTWSCYQIFIDKLNEI